MLVRELLSYPECSHLSPPPNPQHLKAKNEQQTLLSSKAWMFMGNVAKTYLESMYYVSCRISTLVEFCGEGWSFLVHSCLCPDGAVEGPVSTWLLRTSSMEKMILFAFQKVVDSFYTDEFMWCQKDVCSGSEILFIYTIELVTNENFVDTISGTTGLLLITSTSRACIWWRLSRPIENCSPSEENWSLELPLIISAEMFNCFTC
jgi:hypothetical protein